MQHTRTFAELEPSQSTISSGDRPRNAISNPTSNSLAQEFQLEKKCIKKMDDVKNVEEK